MEPRTSAILKGFVLALFTFIIFFLIPYLFYNFFMGFFRDTLILYFFGPPIFRTFLSTYAPRGYVFININFGLIIFLGLPLSAAAFFRGYYKSETVGHGLSGIAFVIILGVSLLVGYGSLGIITFFIFMNIPVYSIDWLTMTIVKSYLSYMSPFVIDIQGIINIFAAAVLLTGLIYVVETGIGISNHDYWRYWSEKEEKKEQPETEDSIGT